MTGAVLAPWPGLIGALAALIILTPGVASAQVTYQVGVREGPRLLSWAYDPPDLVINLGDTVVWANNGVETHTATAELWDSGLMQSGEVFSWTFTEEGKFTYVCTPHPWMRGNVTVGPAAPPEEPAGAIEEEQLPRGEEQLPMEETDAEAAAIP